MQGVPVTVPVPPQVPPEESRVLQSREEVGSPGVWYPKKQSWEPQNWSLEPRNKAESPGVGVQNPKIELGALGLGFGTPKQSWELWDQGLAHLKGSQEPHGLGLEPQNRAGSPRVGV